MQNSCQTIPLYPDLRDKHWAFLTPKALQSLNEYFDKRKRDHKVFDRKTPLFRIVYQLGTVKSKQLHSAEAKTAVYWLVNKASIEITCVKRHFDIYMDHGFRKRFNNEIFVIMLKKNLMNLI